MSKKKQREEGERKRECVKTRERKGRERESE